MEYYIAIKKTKVLICAITLMNLENIIISERGQTQKATSCVIQLYEMYKIGKSIETEGRLVVVRG